MTLIKVYSNIPGQHQTSETFRDLLPMDNPYMFLSEAPRNLNLQPSGLPYALFGALVIFGEGRS